MEHSVTMKIATIISNSFNFYPVTLDIYPQIIKVNSQGKFQLRSMKHAGCI